MGGQASKTTFFSSYQALLPASYGRAMGRIFLGRKNAASFDRQEIFDWGSAIEWIQNEPLRDCDNTVDAYSIYMPYIPAFPLEKKPEKKPVFRLKRLHQKSK